MLRFVAVLLCLAPSQGLRVQGSTAESESLLATAIRDGITYPDIFDLMALDSETLLDLDSEESVDLNQTAGWALEFAKKGDDEAAFSKGAIVDKKVLKEGDGKTFVQKGDAVKVRVTGTSQAKHFEDLKFESVNDYVFPAPKFATVDGSKNVLAAVEDDKILPKMSRGEILEIKIKDKGTGEIHISQVELLEVKKTGSPELVTYVEAKKVPSQKDEIIKVLKRQTMEGMTLNRKVIKAGDGKAPKKGDTVTIRLSGDIVEKGKKITTDTTATFKYPLLQEKFGINFKGFRVPVKAAWDEKLIPDMKEGEIQQIQFDPMQFKFGVLAGPKFIFPSLHVELLKVE